MRIVYIYSVHELAPVGSRVPVSSRERRLVRGEYRLKTVDWYSAGMPMPESITSKSTCPRHKAVECGER